MLCRHSCSFNLLKPSVPYAFCLIKACYFVLLRFVTLSAELLKFTEVFPTAPKGTDMGPCESKKPLGPQERTCHHKSAHGMEDAVHGLPGKIHGEMHVSSSFNSFHDCLIQSNETPNKFPQC